MRVARNSFCHREALGGAVAIQGTLDCFTRQLAESRNDKRGGAFVSIRIIRNH